MVDRPGTLVLLCMAAISLTSTGESITIKEMHVKKRSVPGSSREQLTFAAPYARGFAAKSFYMSQQKDARRTILRLFQAGQQGPLGGRWRLIQNVEAVDLSVRPVFSAIVQRVTSRYKLTSTT